MTQSLYFCCRRCAVFTPMYCLLLCLSGLATVSSAAPSQLPSGFSDKPNHVASAKWASLKAAVQETKLLPSPDGIDGKNSSFGSDVALSGSRAIVGGNRLTGSGAAVIFEHTAAGWEQTAVLQPSDGWDGDLFGRAVSLSGDRALIGSIYGSEGNGGAVYVFEFDGQQWVEKAKLLPSDNRALNLFGASVSLQGDLALVGAPESIGARQLPGAAYVFRFDGTAWHETARLSDSAATEPDYFGGSVKLLDNRALIGAQDHDGNGFNAGAAFVFDLQDSAWIETAKLLASDGDPFDRFGQSVSLSHDRVLIGAQGDDDNGAGAGAAYIFDFDGDVWRESSKLLASDGEGAGEQSQTGVGDQFGYTVLLSENLALITAPSHDDSTGAVYVYQFDGSNWNESNQLSASYQTRSDDSFGVSLGLSGDSFIVGAPAGYGNLNGGAYVFDADGLGWRETAKLTAEPGAPYQDFGYSVSLSGDRALIGAPSTDYYSDGAGAAYVFDFDGFKWVLSSKLVASDHAYIARFGSVVSLSGNRALVAAANTRYRQVGIVYVFELQEGNWKQTAKLSAGFDDRSLSPRSSSFGASLSLDGDRALIGAVHGDGEEDRSGVAHIFEFDGSTWVNTVELAAADGASADRFGNAVSLSNNRALVGALFDNNINGVNAGAVYVFDFDGRNWNEEAKLIASDGAGSDRFGISVSLFGDRALIGSMRGDGLTVDTGAAYIYQYNGTAWGEVAKLIASDGEDTDKFGLAVGLMGDRALVGATTVNEIKPGAVYVFELDGEWWNEKQIIRPASSAPRDRFGASISVVDGRGLVGAFLDDDRGTNAGAAYIFEFERIFTDRFIQPPAYEP